MKLTEAQADMLRHMLGINDPCLLPPSDPYRNYAAVEPGDQRLLELERLGLVECYRKAAPGFEYDSYRATDLGRRLAYESHRRVRLPKPRRVYRRYLSVRDAVPDLTFREFLINPGYADIRRRA